MILQSHADDARSWVLLAAPGCVLALPSIDAAGFSELPARLAGDDGFRTVLELLIAGGIGSAPPFALMDGDSSVARVVLRGEASVTVTAADPDAAELTISGAGMATWSERVLEGARSLRLQVPGSTWTLTLEAAAAPATGALAAVAPATATPAAAAPATAAPAVAPAAGAASAVDRAPAPAEPAAVTAEGATVAPPTPVAEVTLVPRAQIEVPVAVVPADPEDPEPDPEPYDFLFGDTIYRTQSGASVRIPNPDPERPGDHDGRTMLAEDLGLRGHVPEAPVLPELPAAASEATVIAPIPGHVPAAVPADTFLSPSAAGLQLRLERADGSRESLRRPVLIGRAPSAGPVAAASDLAPRLITIVDDKDISRSHVRIAVEGDAVVVTDLASKNGTVVTLPGASPRKLRGGEPTVVLPGTLIDLGGGVTFTVRED